MVVRTVFAPLLSVVESVVGGFVRVVVCSWCCSCRVVVCVNCFSSGRAGGESRLLITIFSRLTRAICVIELGLGLSG